MSQASFRKRFDEESGLVSIVIVTRDRREEVLACLRSVVEQDYPAKEIIVVDDASDDGTYDAIIFTFPEVTIIRNLENVGAPAAKNQGIQSSNGEYVWFLDSDVEILRTECLTHMMRTWETGANIGAIGGEGIFDEQGQPIGVKRSMLRLNGIPRGQIVLGGEQYEALLSDWLITANFLTKREYLFCLGGFDTWYRHFAEDLDLSLRLRALGLDTVVLRKIPILHKSSSKARIFDLFLANKSRMYCIIKNFPLQRLAILPLLDFLYFLDIRNISRAKKYVDELNQHKPQVTPVKEKSLLRTVLRVFKLGVLNACSVVYGYFAIVPLIPYIMRVRSITRNQLTQERQP